MALFHRMIKYRYLTCVYVLVVVLPAAPQPMQAQRGIRFVPDAMHAKRYHILAGADSLALFWYDDTLRKPYLHQVHAPGGQVITRGYPLLTRPEDTTDHPHQVGIWFTYEDVNGTDYWNNSAWPQPNRAGQLGAIVIDSILQKQAGNPATLRYIARWKDKIGNALLREETTLHFGIAKNSYIINRQTTLTALETATFGDAKDGLLGMRVSREMQVPWPGDTSGANGHYLNSEGLRDNAVWGKRAPWVVLHSQWHGETVSILIADHPQNPGYPAYWHARGYGLFAANPLAQKSFDPTMPAKSTQLATGQSLSFKYGMVIATGKQPMSARQASKLAGKMK
jgi:hypothetical protein